MSDSVPVVVVKPWYLSKTCVAAVVGWLVATAGVLSAFGVAVPQPVIDFVQSPAAEGLISFLFALAFYGRKVARSRID